MTDCRPRPRVARTPIHWPGGILTLILAAGFFATACRQSGQSELRKQTRLIMDTYVTLTAWGPTAKADKALGQAFTRLEEINRKFNHLDSASPVFAFNTRGEPITDPEVVGVLRRAVEISRLSGGAFDVTVEPLVRLWGFYGDSLAVPAQSAIDSCLKSVGYEKLVVESAQVTRTDPRTTIDLGGIAKGWALEEAARVLRAAGVDSGIVDLGGDVMVIGRKGDEKWKVGIRNPRGDGILGVLAVSNLAVITSGDYERFFWGPDSVRYCHILDPKTGWPARGMISSTVVTRDPVFGQGMSKVLFVLGPSALELAGQGEHFEGLLIDDNMRAYISPGLGAAMDSRLDSAGVRVESAPGRTR
jgi:thiamine biosynthesis lipoprotein